MRDGHSEPLQYYIQYPTSSKYLSEIEPREKTENGNIYIGDPDRNYLTDFKITMTIFKKIDDKTGNLP